MTAFGSAYAAVYDILAAREDQRGAAALRELLVADATGAVLEVGTGTGRCLPHYRHASKVIALEPDADMRARARRRARGSNVATEVIDGDARRLPFPDGSFDTVVAAWVLCTIPDPRQALREVRRVLRPGGKLRFCEHVRSDDPGLARWQDRMAAPWRWFARGCRCNQETAALLEQELGPADLARFDFEPSSPAIVRPTILGIATKHTSDSSP